jgi:hypothetical protein
VVKHTPGKAESMAISSGCEITHSPACGRQSTEDWSVECEVQQQRVKWERVDVWVVDLWEDATMVAEVRSMVYAQKSVPS